MNINELSKECLQHIEAIAWDDSADAGMKILSIQSLLYQHEANMTARSIEEDDSQISKRKYA